MSLRRPDPDRAPERRDLPASVVRQLGEAARAEPPDDLLDAVMAWVERKPQSRRAWFSRALPRALGIAGLAMVIIAALLLSRGQPSASGALVATDEEAGIRLELTVDKATYAPNEPISAHATLTYSGSTRVTVSGTDPIVYFTVNELGGSRSIENPDANRLMCDQVQLKPGEPIEVPFGKSGGYGPSGAPNHGFFQSFFADPELRLPAGSWEIQAFTRFSPGTTCQDSPAVRLVTSNRITVAAPSPSGPPSDRVEQDGFRLELSVDKAAYAPEEPIPVHTTLASVERGTVTVVGSSSGLVGFSVLEVDGTRKATPVWTADCRQYILQAGKPMEMPFHKSAAVNGEDDPNADFVRQYVEGPDLRLPAGTWEIRAEASFVVGKCGDPETGLTATVRVTVGNGTPVTASLVPTVVPTASPTLAPTQGDGLLSETEAIAAALDAGLRTGVAVPESAKLGTYRDSGGPGSTVAPDTPVWAVVLAGTFPLPSCGPVTATPHPCPTPNTTMLLLLDARDGHMLYGAAPAPGSWTWVGVRLPDGSPPSVGLTLQIGPAFWNVTGSGSVDLPIASGLPVRLVRAGDCAVLAEYTAEPGSLQLIIVHSVSDATVGPGSRTALPDALPFADPQPSCGGA